MKFKNDIELQAGLEDLSGSTGTSGQLLSSTGTGTSWIAQDDIISAASKLVVIACKNTHTATILKGTPVYQTGTVGATDVIEIAPADALISLGHQPAVGLLQQDLAINEFGNVVITGELLNFTTDPIDGLTPVTGQKVFLKSGGGLTLTKPTGVTNGIQNLGLIGKVSGGSAGSITVSSIMRTNDVPNLTTGKIWVGDGNTVESTVVHLDEVNGRMGIGTSSPNAVLNVSGAGDFSGGTVVSGIDSQTDVGISIAKGSYVKSNDGNYLRNLIGQQSGGSIDIGQGGTGLISNINLKPGSSGNIDFFGSGSIDMRVASSGNVGIGTTSPSAKLHVTDGSGGDIAIGTNTTAVKYLNFGLNSDYSIQSNGGSYLRFHTEGSERIRIDSAGNVGIGTTAPSIVGGTAKMTINVGASPSPVSIVNGTTDGMYIRRYDTNGQYQIQTTVGTGNSGNLSLQTYGGNVGIGTTSPGYKLDVSGDARFTGDVTVSGGDITLGGTGRIQGIDTVSAGTDATSKTYVDNAIAGVPQGDITAVTAGTFLTGGGTSGSVTLNADASKLSHIVDSSNASVTAGWITVAEADTARRAGEIYVTDGESGDHSFIRIDWMRSYADSNFTVLNCGGHQNRIQGVRVLQETADPTYGPKYLQVKVTVTSNYYVIITAPGTIPNYSDFTAVTPVLEDTKTGYSVTGAQLENLQDSSVGTQEGITVGEELYVNGGGNSYFLGNVGIGLTSPTSGIHVNTSQSAARFISSQATGLEVQGGGNSQPIASFKDTAASEKVRISSTGNVGIGTTSPDTKLTLSYSANGGSEGLKLNSATRTTTEDNLSAIEVVGNTNYGTVFNVQMDGQIQVSPRGTEAMRIDSSGNVGIGTTSPNTALEVDGAISTTTSDYVQGSTGSRLLLETSGSGNTYSYIQAQNSGGASSAEDLALQLYGGNVGIGTASPTTVYSKVLQINASGNGSTLRLTDAGSGSAVGNGLELLQFGVDSYIINRESGVMRFWNNNASKMVILSNGNVGIGTTSPDAKLHVEGPISSNGLIADFSINGGTGYGMNNLRVEIPQYGSGIRVYSPTSSGTDNSAMSFIQETTSVGGITINTSSTSFNTTSDYRLKENREEISDAIERVKELRPVKFNWIKEPGESKVDGFYAHELAEVVPEAVTGEKDALDWEGNPKYQAIDQAKIVPLLTAALQQAINKIEELELRIQTIENN